MLPCDPLVADAGVLVADALIADAENNGRMISCQTAQRALAACLCELERGGVLKPRDGQASVCAIRSVPAPAPKAAAQGPPKPRS